MYGYFPINVNFDLNRVAPEPGDPSHGRKESRP